jgi:hypothetical protein
LQNKPASAGSYRLLIGVCFLLLGVAALRDVARIGHDLPWHVTTDLPDFYCAGSVTGDRHNPYLYEPLRTCEHRVNRVASFQANPSIAIPAPQPPYDMIAFVPLARLPYGTAQIVFASAVTLALISIVVLFCGLGVAPDVAALAVALSAGYHEMQAGQIVPFVLLLLVLCGWLLARRKDALAGIAAALTMIEPHLGAGVVLCMLLFVPRARIGVFVTGCVLAAIGIATTGAPAFLTYLTRVVSAQAAAEVRFPAQYSVTYLLHAAGVPDAPALAVGTLWGLAALVFGVLLAPRLAAALKRPELLAFFPAATIVFGGAYVHVVELCFAIPAALVLAISAPQRWRTVAAAALALLTVPWIAVWSVKKLFLASVFVMAALLYRLRASRALAITTVLVAAALMYGMEWRPPLLPTPPSLPATSYASGALVQTEWHAIVNVLDVHDPLWLLVKVPAWCALTALFVAALSIVRESKAMTER